MKFVFLLVFMFPLFAAPVLSAQDASYISIIIDDLGYKLQNGRRLIELPAAFTYSILPNSPHGKELAEYAHAHHKEVMLHLPMQARSGTNHAPGILTVYMDEKEFKDTLHSNLQRIPFIAGLNNHEGSYLTRYFKQMGWLMHELAETELYFIDSRTTHHTVAALSAEYYDVPTLNRDVFLDNSLVSADIDSQLNRLRILALQKGFAVAIGHPYAATLSALERFLPQLEENHIVLLPVSALIQHVEKLDQSQNAP